MHISWFGRLVVYKGVQPVSGAVFQPVSGAVFWPWSGAASHIVVVEQTIYVLFLNQYLLVELRQNCQKWSNGISFNDTIKAVADKDWQTNQPLNTVAFSFSLSSSSTSAVVVTTSGGLLHWTLTNPCHIASFTLRSSSPGSTMRHKLECTIETKNWCHMHSLDQLLITLIEQKFNTVCKIN